MRVQWSLRCGIWPLLLAAGSCWAQPIFEDYKLCESDGASSDSFGRCVALWGELIAVGISRDDDLEVDSGSVYCYQRATGEPINKLFPDDAQPGDLFGASVAMGEGVIAVGSVRDDDTVEDSGSVYLFDPVSGLQIKKLHADDPGREDYFGGPLAIGGTTLVVGVRCDDDNGTDSGSAYLFDLDTARQIGKLTADDGQAGDWFGASVSIDGDAVVIGAIWNDNSNGTDAGAVYVFDRTSGEQVRKIIADDGREDDNFGTQVAVSGGVIAILAPGDTHTGQSGTGSVYLYQLATGAFMEKIVPPAGGGPVSFDGGMKLHEGLLAVGAKTGDNEQPHDRMVCVYAVGSGDAPTRFYPSESVDSDDFGYQVALDGRDLLAGAPAFFGLSSGAAYRFTIPDAACAADLDGDGVLTFFDVSAFVGSPTDFNADGSFNFFDVSAFIQAFAAGCP